MNDIIFITAPIHLHRLIQFLEEYPSDKFTLICPSELAPFCRKYTDCRVIVPWMHPNLFTTKNLLSLPLNIVRLYRNWHHYFAGVRKKNIHVFFTGWAVSYMYFIKKLHKHNIVTLWLPYDNFAKVPDYFPEQKDLVSASMRWFARIFLRLNTKVMDKSVPAYEMNRDRYYQKLFDPDKIKVWGKFSKEHKLVKDMDCLFLSENVTTEGADLASVNSLSTMLKWELDKKFGDRWCLKGHPREHDTYGEFKNATNTLSPYIIAEVLYGHPWKIIMSYYSEALISASKLTDAKVVSLVNLFDWGNKTLLSYWRKRMKEYGVLCPKNWKELTELLK